MAHALFDTTTEGHHVLRVHVQPGAGRTAVVGRHGDALKVRVAAPPTGGRANEACAELLAASLALASAQVQLTGGESSRSKRFRIEGVDAADLSRLLEDLLDGVSAAPGGPDNRPGAGR